MLSLPIDRNVLLTQQGEWNGAGVAAVRAAVSGSSQSHVCACTATCICVVEASIKLIFVAIIQKVMKQKCIQDPLSSSSVSRLSSSLLLLPLHPVSSANRDHGHSPVLSDTE